MTIISRYEYSEMNIHAVTKYTEFLLNQEGDYKNDHITRYHYKLYTFALFVSSNWFFFCEKSKCTVFFNLYCFTPPTIYIYIHSQYIAIEQMLFFHSPLGEIYLIPYLYVYTFFFISLLNQIFFPVTDFRFLQRIYISCFIIKIKLLI